MFTKANEHAQTQAHADCRLSEKGPKTRANANKHRQTRTNVKSKNYTPFQASPFKHPLLWQPNHQITFVDLSLVVMVFSFSGGSFRKLGFLSRWLCAYCPELSPPQGAPLHHLRSFWVVQRKAAPSCGCGLPQPSRDSLIRQQLKEPSRTKLRMLVFQGKGWESSTDSKRLRQ